MFLVKLVLSKVLMNLLGMLLVIIVEISWDPFLISLSRYHMHRGIGIDLSLQWVVNCTLMYSLRLMLEIL